MMDDRKYCAWKQTLDELLKSKPSLEQEVLKDKKWESFRDCYFCNGYNFECKDYLLNYTVNH